MSTVVVVRKGEVACIAAETLTAYGSIKESAEYVVNHSKIVKVGTTFLATVGHPSTELIYASYFSNKRRTASFGGVQEIFETMREMHAVLKDEYYLNEDEDEDDPYESLQMASLVANPHGIFGIYELRAVFEYSKFYAFGSGSELALGAMFVAYPRLETAEEIARIAVEAAAEFDRGSALPMEVHTVQLAAKG